MDYILLICITVLLFCIITYVPFIRYSDITLKHELAHARAAVEYGHSTFVILKDAKTKDDEYVEVVDGIKIYHITKKRYEKDYGESGGKCIHYNDKFENSWMQITKAGPIASCKCIFKITCITSVGILLVFWGLKSLNVLNCPTVKFLVILLIATVAALLYHVYANWKWSKKSMEKMEDEMDEIIRKNEKNSNITSISDGTKLHFKERYENLLKKYYVHIDLFIPMEKELEKLADIGEKKI